MSERATARHRAPQRPLTPLDALTDTLTGGLTAVTEQVGSVGRSGAVLAVSTGLVATMGLPAHAVSRTAPENGAAVARTSVLTAASVALPASVTNGAAVSAPVTATVTFERDALAVKKAPPKPKPKVVQEVRTTQRASRSTARVAATGSSSSSSSSKASRSEILSIARSFIGTPYVYGGSSPSGFDCSGFTQYVLGRVGISVPRTTAQQYGAVRRISRGEAVPGDLVFIFTSGRVTHVGFYLGGNRILDSPRSGKTIQEREIWTSNIAFGRP